MKQLLILFFIISSIGSFAQVICGTANEGGSVTLTAPAGQVFTAIEFASYGTPGGVCGSFTIGGCHAANSLAVTQDAFIGQNSATINATNAVFGDPCNGTGKQLFVQARYSSTLPLTLLSFSIRKLEQGLIKLEWTTDHEIQTSQFVIERSSNGILFETAGVVSATGSGANTYSYTDNLPNISNTIFYRLKMVDLDGKYKYSNIARIDNKVTDIKLALFPNPATEFITIVSDKIQEGVIVNAAGQILHRIPLINGNQVINISSYVPGIYILKTSETALTFIKK